MYIDFDEYLIEEEKKLNLIYKELLKNNQDKDAIKKFDRIVKSKIDYRGLLPCTKSYEGETLLTLSKTWMIIILIKITKGKTQQEQFLTLINSSLTHELNEYEEYKAFYEEQCEILFSDEEAINQINLNPQTPNKIDNSISHEELKDFYIYLLFRPKYFQRINLNGLSKYQKKEEDENVNKNKKRKSENSYKDKQNKNKKTKSGKSDVEITSDTEDNDEKGDRLNEKDMISKNRAKQPSNRASAKTNKNSNSNKNKNKSEKEDIDYLKINDILNKKGKSGKKKKSAEKKSGNKKNKKSYLNSIDIEDETSESAFIEINTSINDKKAKKNKNKKKNKKYEETDESEEEETTKKRNKNKNKKEKEKNEKNKKSEMNQKDKKNKKKYSAKKIFNLLGIDKNESDNEEEKEEKEEKEGKKNSTKYTRKRKTISVPQRNKKEKSKNKNEESSNKKKKKNKEKTKNSGKKKEKTKKTKKAKTDDEGFFSDEEDEEDMINTLSELSNNESDESEDDKYGDNLEKINQKEKKKMQKEIDMALKGESNFDLEELLGESNVEGIPLDQFDSGASSSDNDIDIDED